MIDCNIKENRKKVRRNVIDVIRVTNERGYPYAQIEVDELIEIDSVLERQEEIIEEQEERIAIMSEGGWRDASKRPPKEGRYLVLGLHEFTPDHCDMPNAYWQTRIAQWSNITGWDTKVKYWQELPEPPEE